ncbi:nodulation protein NolO-like [Amphiura filiformis]|uniref:nodulation protein NolO-like n=1 Tax=Amphiura filiformis TaxID=82378 RepID=UPI003B22271B
MKVIGLFSSHDSNVAVSVDGEIKVVLELERMTGVRYYCSPQSKKNFTSDWSKAISLVTEFTGIQHFDVCVSNWFGRAQFNIMKTLIDAERWVEFDHHKCHASLGFYGSPFNSALVISSDAAGNITAFETFSATRENGLVSLKKPSTHYGLTFIQIATMLEEVTGPNFWDQDNLDFMPEGPTGGAVSDGDFARFLVLPGKKMGYAALGKPRQGWFECMEELYKGAFFSQQISYTLLNRLQLDEFPINDSSVARDVAATSQYWFTKKHCNKISEQLDRYLSDPNNPAIDGIVLTGGCALNVFFNQVVVEKFGLPVHVPCAPNDCGISAGACWLIEPPKKFKDLMYTGLPLFDHDEIDAIAKERNARKVTVSEIADLLMQRHIIGVVRGRAEFGPRALGHRSLLAYPDQPEQLTRVNRLKGRQFYRPACPSVTEQSAVKIFKGRKESDRFVSHEDGLDLFDSDERFCKTTSPTEGCCQFPDETRPDNFLPRSPYMSFAPTMRDECRNMFPAVCHFDNTARLQTVSKESEPWFHSLLQEIGQRNGGYEILINTSFNVKGKPILNELKTALEIMDNEPDGLLPYVVCEDWLFTRKDGITNGLMKH